MITKEEKLQVIQNLKKYKEHGSKIYLSQLDTYLESVYSWSDILRIIMGGPYEATTDEILDRIIELLEA